MRAQVQCLSGERQVDKGPAILQCRDFCRGWELVGMQMTRMGGAVLEGKAVSMREEKRQCSC